MRPTPPPSSTASLRVPDPMALIDERGWLAVAIQVVDEPAWAGIQVGEPPDDRVYEGYGATLDDAVAAAYTAALVVEGRV